MSNIIEYKDIMAFHPGYYVAEIIEDMEISQDEFATRLGTTGKTVSKLVRGQINLSNDLAKKLSVMLGTSVEIWLNLQSTYEKKIIEIECEKDFDEQKSIARLIDYAYFVKLAGIPETKNIHEKVQNLCKYFMISDLRILREPDFLVNFRTGISTVEEKNIINSRAWIQTAMNISKEIVTKPFDAKNDFISSGTSWNDSSETRNLLSTHERNICGMWSCICTFTTSEKFRGKWCCKMGEC